MREIALSIDAAGPSRWGASLGVDEKDLEHGVDLLIDRRPDCSLYYVAFKSRYPAGETTFGAERHISTGATLSIQIS
jgi:hypothetical protein